VHVHLVHGEYFKKYCTIFILKLQHDTLMYFVTFWCGKCQTGSVVTTSILKCCQSSTIFGDVNVKNIFTSHIDKKKLLTLLTSLSLYIFTQPEPLNRNESGRFGALKSDSTHHFFRNACTKSGSLRFSQFFGWYYMPFALQSLLHKGNNKITELRTILQSESPNS
jgi:hypothetical protein